MSAQSRTQSHGHGTRRREFRPLGLRAVLIDERPVIAVAAERLPDGDVIACNPIAWN
jgi:hypothetical protein